MVRITNGVNKFEVTKGAFKGFYSKQGYTEIVEKVEPVKDESSEEENEEGKELSEDETFVNEILEKPISQWSKSEVKRYVAIMNIDTSKASTLNEVKEIIKATF